MPINKHAYASSSAVRRAVAAVENAGLHVGGIKLHPNGTIELIRASSPDATAANDFDRLEAQGLL